MTTHLSGNASGISVGKVAHGLMTMTWTQNVVPDEVAFEAIKASIDALPAGSKRVLNSGEFYGINPKEANLELISRFFEKYPEYADRAFLSVKGGIDFEKFAPDASEEGLRRSVDNIISKLRGKKHLDLFECARVDPKHPIEETIGNLAKLVKEGKFDHIGMSECSAATLRRAHAVHPITAAEIEISLFSYEEETKKVIEAGKELGITVFGYSPIGRGILSGAVSSKEDLKGFATQVPKFQGELFEHNMKLVNVLKKFAEKKDVTLAQLAIAWVGTLGDHVIPLPGSSNEKRTKENMSSSSITFTESELKELNKIVDEFEVKGGRYPEGHTALLWG